MPHYVAASAPVGPAGLVRVVSRNMRSRAKASRLAATS
jgi:hypothetical protein